MNPIQPVGHETNSTNMLAIFDTVTVDEMAQISAADKLFCEEQQQALYETLDQLDKWYNFFTKEAEQYSECTSYKENGSIQVNTYSSKWETTRVGYKKYEFLPFKNIDKIVEERCNAIAVFYQRIVNYFNKTYSLIVEIPKVDESKLVITFRPVFSFCVNVVINHLGGSSFREVAEAEALKRFLKVAMPGYGKEPELKGDKIVFYKILSFDDFYVKSRDLYKVHYHSDNQLDPLCEGLALANCNILNGDTSIIKSFRSSDINMTDPYDLTTEEPKQMKFFKNGRIDVKFSSKAKAETAYHRLRLNVPHVKTA